MSDKHIHVEALARVEGESALDIRIRDGQIEELVLNINEPPRFFEGFLAGRKYYELPDITARICGICPVSYQIASILAVEDAFGVVPAPQTVALREIFSLSQWLQSHTLHIYMLALPDYLGYDSVLSLPPEYTPVVQRALRMKRLGNDITRLIGGREVHPVTVVVNGFTHIPARSEMEAIRERLKACKEDAWETGNLVATLKLPDLVNECEHVALTDERRYGINGGMLASTKGWKAPLSTYRDYITERHAPPSNALRSYVEDSKTYLVGPLARVNVNFSQLSPDALVMARDMKVAFPNFNPYVNAAARAIETMHAIDRMIELIDAFDYREPDRVYTVRAGVGHGASEAPRGLLYHSYEFDSEGVVKKATIVSPTAQNSANIEENLWRLVPDIINAPLEVATLECEKLIRAYDPCFSCSAHFLKLRIQRE
ncbi:MAG: Ni/Fe hydrogenase subunit alpha [Armatimonadetes bacterium]|nr:Ni/Fe hydrogenase subunit alpha [Armatimonadota bacterium]